MLKKEAYDWKCMQGSQPLATLEKFLFVHLSEKYGLRSIVVQQAAQIIDSIRFYMHEDALVLFAAKALKNLCPTGYRNTMKLRQEEVQQAVLKVLKEHMKTQLEGQKELEKLVLGKTQLSHSAWVKCADTLIRERHSRNEFLA